MQTIPRKPHDGIFRVTGKKAAERDLEVRWAGGGEGTVGLVGQIGFQGCLKQCS